MNKIGLNSNQLKLIAAVSMLLDHVGYLVFILLVFAFYAFYPVHLVLIYAVDFLIK